MIPYMILTIPIYLIVRFIFFKSKNRKVNWYHEVVLFLFVIFIGGLASQTIIPKFELRIEGFKIVKSRIHETNLIPFKVLFETYKEVFVNGHINYFLINFLGNIIIFIPFGFIIPLLWNVSNTKVIIIGFCSSLFIEICQLFLARGTDIDDLMLNTFGVIIGLLIYKLLIRKNKQFINKFNNL